MRTAASVLTATFALVSMAGSMAGTPAAAQQATTCATEPVIARGEPARYDWLARTKARANWRRKVRATPGLGTPYSEWTNATAAEEVCLAGPAGTACTFTGTPCRK